MSTDQSNAGKDPIPVPQDDSGKDKSDDAGLGSYGNAAGSKIESTLKPVGGPIGEGLQSVTKPVGGVVDSVVGGVMRAPDAMNNAKEQTKKHEQDQEPIGGKDQNAENPLGL